MSLENLPLSIVSLVLWLNRKERTSLGPTLHSLREILYVRATEPATMNGSVQPFLTLVYPNVPASELLRGPLFEKCAKMGPC